MTKCVVDIGGTYIRLALSHDGESFLQDPQKIKTDKFSSVEDALTYFMYQEQCDPLSITDILIAKSGRNHWIVEQESIRATFPVSKIIKVGDFEANALGLIGVKKSELIHMGGVRALPDTDLPMAVIGSGTGLGLAYILPNQYVHGTHGGHMLPALVTSEQIALFDELQTFKRDDTAPIYEDALSGDGILNIYKILCRRHHLDSEYTDTHHLMDAGRNNPMVRQALKYYHEILGLFAHQVLAFGYSYGALFLTGGITDRLVGYDLFDKETFFKTFYQNNVPIVLHDVKSTPVFWVKDEFISLRGLLRESVLQES
jgi:glucokinase